ncbi:Transmembrane osmosensor [Entomophthora muscae]|uniref:Transmembrane osmosensor n=1 Tax=Entomophthora muscae TaxID=34485 RepID=A0ACC2UHR8_9FUNG|nr:Transmembrane osmosensor [Entomophthora muscae]
MLLYSETPITRLTYNKPLFYSIVLGVLFWITALCGTVLSDSDEKPIGILWFYAIFSLIVLIGVIAVTSAGLLIKYRATVLSFTSIAFTFSVLAIQNLTFKLDPPTIVATIGYFLFTFVLFFWMLTIGHLEDTKVQEGLYANYPATFYSGHNDMHTSFIRQETASDFQNNFTGLDNQDEIQFNIQARALYSYQVNPGDSSELSFEKGDILYISETQGKWWLARDASGKTGTVPSNFIELI